jgi:hypothetical protein
LDTGCVFWGKTETAIANTESEKIVAKQGEQQIDNDGENPS